MARRNVIWSTKALVEFKSILEFYKIRNFSNVFSKELSTKIQYRIKQLSFNPYIGQKTDYMNIRTYIIGDYQIIYEIFDAAILIVSIWDCRRDPENKFDNERR